MDTDICVRGSKPNEYLQARQDGRICKYARQLNIGCGKIIGCTCSPYKGKWVAEIDKCPIGREERK